MLAALLVATCLPSFALAGENPKVALADQATTVTDLDEQLRAKFMRDRITAMFPDYDISGVLAIVPVIVLSLIFSRRFIEGMTSGSVKG